jgi:hypothetical protein
MIIGKKSIDAIKLFSFKSTSGKYDGFLATHYDGKQQCYDVGTFNNATGEVVRRHYKKREVAIAFYSNFRDKMTAQGAPPEDEDYYTTLG